MKILCSTYLNGGYLRSEPKKRRKYMVHFVNCTRGYFISRTFFLSFLNEFKIFFDCIFYGDLLNIYDYFG